MKIEQAIKILITGLLLYTVYGCEDDSSPEISPDPENEKRLKGTYQSDCYYSPMLSTYVIENLEYNENTYTNAIEQYSASDCSSAVEDVLNTWGDITYYDDVMTTDGVMARRANFDIDTGGVAVAFEGVVELVYRKTETELYFGSFTEGETPTVSYALTYYKQ